MSIRIRDLRKPASYAGAPHPLFDGVDLEVEDGAHIGILGTAKTGKSTLLRLMCGTELADGGVVERTSRPSWPIPLVGFVMMNSTVAMNIRFVARLYGIRDDAFPRRIAESVEIADFLNIAIKKCPRFVRPRLALAIGIGIESDIYLFDGSFAPADRAFKEKATEIVAGKMAQQGYVLATSFPAEAEQHCDSVYVLEAGRAKFFAEAKKGVEYFKEMVKAAKQAQDSGGAQPGQQDEDDDESGDIDLLGTAIASAIE